MELVRSSAVHPYHLLRYDWAIFSQPAMEKMQVSLKNSVSKRQRKAESRDEEQRRKPRARRGAGCVMKKRRRSPDEIRISDHSPAGDYGKRPGHQGKPEHAGLPGGAEAATKTEIKEAVQSIFKVKVHSVRTAMYPGKERRRGKFAGYRPDWKKAYVRLKSGEKMPEYAQNL